MADDQIVNSKSLPAKAGIVIIKSGVSLAWRVEKTNPIFKGPNYAKSVTTMVYEGFDEPWRRENKANQTQFQDPTILYKGTTKLEKVVKRTKICFYETGSFDINPYQLQRYTGLSGMSQSAKCPNTQFTNSFLAQKERFTRKTAIKFPSKSGFLKILGAKSAKRLD